MTVGASYIQLGGWFIDLTFSVNVLKGKLWNEASTIDESEPKKKFRDYDAACDRVKQFYKEQHGLTVPYKTRSYQVDIYFTAKQTVEFNIKARVDFKMKKRARMSVWEAMEKLNTLIDESDPDVRSFPLLPSPI